MREDDPDGSAGEAVADTGAGAGLEGVHERHNIGAPN
jgi:hypothetical protein